MENKKIEEVELIELNDDALDEVAGGRTININTGCFSTKKEALLYAETVFKPGLYYRYQGQTVQCFSTDALSNSNGWYAICRFRYSNGNVGYATVNYFR